MKWVVLVAAACVGVSFWAEYGWGLAPCSLCWMQRALYLVVIPAAVMGMFWKWGRICCLGLLCLNFLVASYQTLIQWGLIEDRCQSKRVSDFISYKEMLQNPGCSERQWSLGPIPASACNGIVLFGLISRRKLFL